MFDIERRTVKRLAARGELFEFIIVEVGRNHQSGVGIEIQIVVSDLLPSGKVLAVFIRFICQIQGNLAPAVAAGFLAKRRFGLDLQIRPKHIVVGVSVADLVDHTGFHLFDRVPGGNDMIDRAVLIGDIFFFQTVRKIAKRERRDVFLGRAGIEVARKDRKLFCFENTFDVR